MYTIGKLERKDPIFRNSMQSVAEAGRPGFPLTIGPLVSSIDGEVCASDVCAAPLQPSTILAYMCPLCSPYLIFDVCQTPLAIRDERPSL